MHILVYIQDLPREFIDENIQKFLAIILHVFLLGIQPGLSCKIHKNHSKGFPGNPFNNSLRIFPNILVRIHPVISHGIPFLPGIHKVISPEILSGISPEFIDSSRDSSIDFSLDSFTNIS